MAQAPALLPGYQYRIKPNGGDLAGDTVTILDNITFPDSDPRRRKVTVEHDGNTIYLLPRVIEDLPIGMASEPTLPSGPPMPVQAAVESAFTPQVVVNTHTEAPVSAIGALAPITDPMDPRLDHLRPRRSKVNRYRNRVMANGMTDVEFLLAFTSDPYRNQNEGRPANICLKGDTQSGKTFLIEALAWAWSDMLAEQQRQRGEKVTFTKAMPIFTLSGSAGVTDYDLFGQTTSYTDPTSGMSMLIWLSGIADLAARCGGILYLDEMNFMGERVTSSLHSLIDHRHQFVNRNKPVWKDGQFMPETVTAHLDLWVVSSLNEGYRGTGVLNEAFSNRFEHILWGYNDDVEKRLVPSPSIRLFADALRTARAAKSIQSPVGTSALERFALNIATFGQGAAFQIFLGMFQPAERGKVEAIYIDRTFKRMIEDEVMQAATNAAKADDAPVYGPT